MQARIRLLSRSAEVRQIALGQLDEQDAADVYSARRALLEDSDGRVRALAARFLGRAQAVSPVPWLHDATYDDLPSVREAAARALGQLGGLPAQRTLPRLTRLALLDSVWWVRRTATVALARIGQASAIPTLKAVLGDPFWRVRHAGIEALALLWQALPDEREQILQVSATMNEACQSAHLELQSRVEPQLAAYKAPAPPALDQSLANPDPAVTTARLRVRPPSDVPPAELLPLLADPHTALRTLAIERLARQIKATELEEVLPHMVIPGLPHALESACELLDRTGRRGQALIGRILSDNESPVGAVKWACQSLMRTGGRRAPLRATLLHPHPLARLAALRALDELGETDVTLFERLVEDEDAEVRSAALQALVVRVPDADLGRYLPELLGPDSRPLCLLSLLGRAALSKDRVLLQRLADDEHPLLRARALRALGQMGRLGDATGHAHHPDPLVRQAVVPWLPVEELIRLLGEDPDPLIPREVLRQAYRRRAELSEPDRKRLIAAAAKSPDPWLRSHVVSLLSPEDDLPLLLSLARDAQRSVRQAVADKLDGSAGQKEQIHALLKTGQLDEEQQAAAYAECLKIALLEPNQSEALADLAGELRRPDLPTLALPIRAAVAALRGDLSAPIETPTVYPTRLPSLKQPSNQPPAPRRMLGKTQMEVSPLALSGRCELPPRAFARALDAGVNLFFWEPGYEALSRLLIAQRKRLHIIAGSYEGDRDSIVADVDRALRRLRTDCLDVFLLFWVRSPERLSDEVLATFEQLKAAGKIRAAGFSTHDRSLAELAVRTGGWDVLMTRHSAAHPGAERSLFPLCAEREIGLLTFSATSYGRLLEPLPGVLAQPVRFSAADCYRYSLAQPGVSSVISAPQFPSELDENLAVLTCQQIAPETRLALLQHGEAIHAVSRRFNALVRKGHESPLHAPNEQANLSTRLAELLAEHPAPPSEPLAMVTARRQPKNRPERRS